MIIDVATDPGYQVVISPGARAQLQGLVASATRVAIIHPAPLAGLARTLADTLTEQSITFIEVPDAEDAKTPTVLAQAWDALAAAGFTRDDFVVGLGGERPPTWPVSLRRVGCAGSATLRSPPHCWVPWTPPWAGRPEST